jgi:hypothetical protein
MIRYNIFLIFFIILMFLGRGIVVINCMFKKNLNIYNTQNFYLYTCLTLLNSTFDLNTDFYFVNNSGKSKKMIH